MWRNVKDIFGLISDQYSALIKRYMAMSEGRRTKTVMRWCKSGGCSFLFFFFEKGTTSCLLLVEWWTMMRR